MELLTKIAVKNYRCIGDLEFEPGKINVFFGPNGVGKTTFLDTLWFIRDCSINGIDEASANREHGIGLIYDQAVADAGETDPTIDIHIETPNSLYDLKFGFGSGRIDSNFGEKLHSKTSNKTLINRKKGEVKAKFYHHKLDQNVEIDLTDRDTLAISMYESFTNYSPVASRELFSLLKYVKLYNSRAIDLYSLRRYGSESDQRITLFESGRNLVSVLRNLKDKIYYDKRDHPTQLSRYEIIVRHMSMAFPHFRDFIFEQSSPHSAYISFVMSNRKVPIFFSGVSDGMIQLLLVLTALFCSEPHLNTVLLFDEPEISLHPWAIAVFAKAVKEASNHWNKQIFISTHSPVLISQFENEALVECSLDEKGSTQMKKLSEYGEKDDIRDLLDEFAAGDLYMTENIGGQSTNE